MVDASAPTAFFAGLVSFLSPCVLPLVPGYLSYMSGLGAAEEQSPRRSARTGIVAIVFVLGFTAVFVVLGASATLLGSLLSEHQRGIARVGGLVIIVMGLLFMGVVKVPWLYREARFHPTPGAGVWGSATLGAAFAFGWTPCIGPTMAIALAMAGGRGATGGPAEGAFLLGIYSLGLGLPFIAAGFGVSRLTGAVTWLRRHSRAVTMSSGILLVAVGVLFATGEMFRISIWMNKTLTAMNLNFWSNI